MAAQVIAALGAAAAEYARSRTQQSQNAPKVGKLRDPYTGVAVRVSALPGADPSAPQVGYSQGPQARFASDIIRLPNTVPGAGSTQLPISLDNPMIESSPGVYTPMTSTGRRARTSGTPVFGGVAVRGRRRRRMNVTNVKALRRSERRVAGFVKLARRFVTFHTSHKLKHHRRRR